MTQDGLTPAQQQLQVAQEKFQAGVAPPVEVLRATGQVMDLQATLLQLEGNRTLALLEFRQTMGLPLDAPTQPMPQTVQFQGAEDSLEDWRGARALDSAAPCAMWQRSRPPCPEEV